MTETMDEILHLSIYVEAFAKEAIDEIALSLLTRNHLKVLGIIKFGPLTKICDVIEKNQQRLTQASEAALREVNLMGALHCYALQDCIEKFKEEEFDFVTFCLLNKQMLTEDLHITKLGHIVKILKLGKILSAAANAPTVPVDPVPIVACPAMPEFTSASFNDTTMPQFDASLKRIENNIVYAPLVVLLQASGYGKTRLVLEKLKTRQGVYILCKNILGGWQCPKVVSDMITRLAQEKDDAGRERIAVKFLLAVKAAASETAAGTAAEIAMELFQRQVTDSGVLGEFYEDLNEKWCSQMTPTQSPIKVGDQKERQASDSAASKPAPLLVVFDEATGLGDDGYAAMKRVLRPEGVVGVFLDTSSKLTTFLPEGDPSARSAGLGKLLLPVFDFSARDVAFSPSQSHGDAHASIFYRVFTLGRPLWAAQLEHRCNGNLNELVRFASSKLMLQHKPNGDTAAGFTAMFVCRFGMGPRCALAEQLTSSHMATLVGMTRDRKTVEVKYHSEPVLAEASALFTSDAIMQMEVLNTVVRQLNEGLLAPAKGDRGEVAAAAALGYLADALRMPQKYDAQTANFSAPQPVLLLLRKLYNGDVNDEIVQQLKGCTYNFTHFYQLPKQPEASVLPLLWSRHAAAYSHTGAEGIDLFLPLLCTTPRPHTSAKMPQEFATVRIQVKNYREQISKHVGLDLLRKLAPHMCAPKALSEPLTVAVLINVGIGGVDKFCRTMSYRARTRTNDADPQMLVFACALQDVDLPSEVVAALRGVAGPPSNFVFASERCREGVFATMFETDVVEEEEEKVKALAAALAHTL